MLLSLSAKMKRTKDMYVLFEGNPNSSQRLRRAPKHRDNALWPYHVPWHCFLKPSRPTFLTFFFTSSLPRSSASAGCVQYHSKLLFHFCKRRVWLQPILYSLLFMKLFVSRYFTDQQSIYCVQEMLRSAEWNDPWVTNPHSSYWVRWKVKSVLTSPPKNCPMRLHSYLWGGWRDSCISRRETSRIFQE